MRFIFLIYWNSVFNISFHFHLSRFFDMCRVMRLGTVGWRCGARHVALTRSMVVVSVHGEEKRKKVKRLELWITDPSHQSRKVPDLERGGGRRRKKDTEKEDEKETVTARLEKKSGMVASHTWLGIVKKQNKMAEGSLDNEFGWLLLDEMQENWWIGRAGGTESLHERCITYVARGAGKKKKAGRAPLVLAFVL